MAKVISFESHDGTLVCLRIMRGSSLVIALTLLSQACAQEHLHKVHLRSVLDEASKNELRPTSELKGLTLLVSGVVEQTGLKKQNERRESGIHTGFGYWQSETHLVRAQYPYVILAPKEGGTGRALCFFETQDMQKVVELKVGDTVQFRAKLQEFLKKNGQEVMVLACGIQTVDPAES